MSSWALTLATAWPHHQDRVLVEADCSGGVFGARYDIPVEPGSADLVSQARRGRFEPNVDVSRFARHVKTTDLGSELWVVPSPLASHEALDVWRAMATPTAEAMLYDDRLWVADCGRVWHRSPVEPLLAVAPLNIIVSDASMSSLLVLKSRVDSLPNRSAIIVVGDVRYSTDELLNFTGADYVWNVPYVRGLDILAAQFATGGRARRSKAWRAALTITHTLSADVQAGVGAALAAPAATPAPVGPPVELDPPTPTPEGLPTDIRTPGPAKTPTPQPPPPSGKAERLLSPVADLGAAGTDGPQGAEVAT